MVTDRNRRPVVVIGDLDVARRTCASLEDIGHRVRHLLQPSEEDLSAGLNAEIGAVIVLVRGDVTALRYALFIEHKLPGVRLVVTLFDRTVADQLVRVVPNCVVTSPADIAVPSIVRACRSTGGPVGGGKNRRLAGMRRLAHAVSRQCRPYDASTRTLVVGLTALLLVVLSEWLISVGAFSEPPWRALYDSARTAATVGSRGRAAAPTWYLAYSSMAILVTVGVTAVFTASVVNYLHSSRSVRLFGRLTVPRRDHVIVVGLGQVGLRLCAELKAAGVPVLAIERDPNATNLRLARLARVPVLVAHGEDRAVLAHVSLGRAHAIAAMASDDLDNVEVAIAALAVCPGVRVILRAGESDVIAETKSLFQVGEVCNVSALTADFITSRVLPGETADSAEAHTPALSRADQDSGERSTPSGRCSC